MKYILILVFFVSFRGQGNETGEADVKQKIDN